MLGFGDITKLRFSNQRRPQIVDYRRKEWRDLGENYLEGPNKLTSCQQRGVLICLSIPKNPSGQVCSEKNFVFGVKARGCQVRVSDGFSPVPQQSPALGIT